MRVKGLAALELAEYHLAFEFEKKIKSQGCVLYSRPASGGEWPASCKGTHIRCEGSSYKLETGIVSVFWFVLVYKIKKKYKIIK